jgi:serine-aspartate repeat-containing protein C/D/E
VDGVTVQLLDGSTVVATTTTANGGLYSFTNVADGTYSVKFTTAGNYTFTTQDQGGNGNDTLDSDVNASGQTATFAVAGSNITHIDAGLKGTHITSRVFGDLDRDGVQDAGETGVDGVVVRLLNSVGGIVATQTTANGGTYDFANVSGGTYSLEFVTPSGFAFSPKDAGGDDTLDSDVNIGTGRTDQFAIVVGQTIDTVDAGMYATAGFGTYTFTNDTDVSFPVASANQTVSTITIGGVSGPISEVKVHITGLYHTLPDDLDFWLVGPDGVSNLLILSDVGGVTGNGPINLVIYDAAGAALPDAGGLASGNYRPTDFTTAADPETAANFGGGPTLVHPAPVGVGTFASQFTGLSPNGTWTLYARDDSGGDAGGFGSWSIEVTTASVSVIGDKVFEDLDGDGIQDAGEAGVDGIGVQLLDASNAVVSTTTTANGGLYSFTGVLDGTYSVKFVIAGGQNYIFTTQNAGNDALDSDADATTGQTAQFAVAGNNITHIDAGLRGTHVGDKVFGDLDRDGVQDAGESGLDGVVVQLLNSGNAVVATTETANGGLYDFANVAAGTYSVKVVLPTAFSFSPKDAGSATDFSDSDADPTTGQTAQFNVAVGQTVAAVDVGVYATNGVGTFTFSNDTGVTYPTAPTTYVVAQTFSVGGVAGGISDIKVHFNGLSHNLLDDLDFLLVGPDGTSNVLLWSDVGGTAANAGAINIVLSDAAAGALPDSTRPTSGTYKPTDYTGIDGTETGASFGASGVTTLNRGTFASAFFHQPANGTWTLYIRDDQPGDGGTLGSWDLEITTEVLNEPPAIANVGGDASSFTEGGSAVLLDVGANAEVSDTDSTNFNGGSLVISITANEVAGEDVLGISTAGTLRSRMPPTSAASFRWAALQSAP